MSCCGALEQGPPLGGHGPQGAGPRDIERHLLRGGVREGAGPASGQPVGAVLQHGRGLEAGDGPPRAASRRPEGPGPLRPNARCPDEDPGRLHHHHTGNAGLPAAGGGPSEKAGGAGRQKVAGASREGRGRDAASPHRTEVRNHGSGDLEGASDPRTAEGPLGLPLT